MMFTQEEINGLDEALNEATLIGIEFDKRKEIVAATFSMLAVDENGKVPQDSRLQFIFQPVGKLIASYRLGNWDDEQASILKFDAEEISKKVEEFGQQPIYGWEFIDCKNQSNNNWMNRLSFQYESQQTHGRLHTFDLFQEGDNKHIDIKIWFDELKIYNPENQLVDLQTVINNGKRAWDGIYNGSATDKFNIYPLGSNKKE